MNREIIDRVFRRDFSKLLGFDLFEVTDDLEFVTFKDWFQELLIKPVTVPLITATRNLIHVVTQFMEYDPERFPNPLDQYIYIYENREEILRILASDLKVDNPFDCPIAYTLWYRLNARFERLFRHILTVGRTHKFDPDYIVDHLLVGSDEPETD